MNVLSARLLLIIPLIIFSSCDLPEDPRGTFEKVKQNKVIAGYSESNPWVIESGTQPEGIEPWIINQIADSLNSQIEWVNDSETKLFEMLKKGELHIVISGLTDESPFISEAAFTKPYYTSRDNKNHVVAVLQGENKWLMHIEEFLHRNKQKIQTYIENH